MKAVFDPFESFEKFLVIVIILGYFVAGFFAHKFLSFILIKAMVLSIFAMGYSILFARTGYLSFGHAAFFAVSAYSAGLFVLHIKNSMLLALVVALLFTLVVSAIIGFLSLLRSKIYFAMLTLAFGMGIYTIIWEWESLTGGDDGLIGINRSSLFGSISLVPISHYYFFALVLLILTAISIYFIVYSPLGLILNGIKENETRMRYAGFSPKIYSFLAFVISGLFAGVAGYIDVFLENSASPVMAHWSESALPIFAVLLGGIESFSGPMVGALLLTLLITFLQTVSSEWKLWYGLIFIVVILGLRGGIVGFVKSKLKGRGGEQ